MQNRMRRDFCGWGDLETPYKGNELRVENQIVDPAGGEGVVWVTVGFVVGATPPACTGADVNPTGHVHEEGHVRKKCNVTVEISHHRLGPFR